MKIIEAMKHVKNNLQKVKELQDKISKNCANMDMETSAYGEDTAKKVSEWCQSCDDLSQENVRLLTSIQRTNLVTSVTIDLGAKNVTKTIAEWVWRRREYAKSDLRTWQQLTDRNLKEGTFINSVGQHQQAKITRHYDVNKRDEMLDLYRSEPMLVDAALEIVNATTDIIEKD